MKKIETGDGSETFFNEQAEQWYHSKSGAYEEAVEKYVVPCKVVDGQKILDFCFGLGYNSFAAINHAKHLDIVGLENDANLLKNLSELSFQDESLKESYADFIAMLPKGEVRSSKLHVILGDAKQTIKKLEENSFDIIFFDPFSPNAQPEMWSCEVFNECFRVLKQNGVLATYSCARKVRDAMRSAGFLVKDGPCVRRRAPATLGYKE